MTAGSLFHYQTDNCGVNTYKSRPQDPHAVPGLHVDSYAEQRRVKGMMNYHITSS